MKLKNVEDIYPLSPMQATMLFHASTQANKLGDRNESNVPSDVLFNQVHFKLSGNINIEKFQNSWQILLNRHQSLRSSFVFSGLKQPQQIVRQKLSLPFTLLDLSGNTETEQLELLGDFLKNDNTQGIALEKAPLMRIGLIRFSENQYHFIWSTHHLIIDRWCIPILFDEFTTLYNEPSKPLPKAPQFKRYISWLKSQDQQKCAEYWHSLLHGFSHPTAVTKLLNHNHITSESTRFQLNQHTVEQLKKQCNQHTLTLATMIKAAWSLLLSELNDRSDVMFGLVVSGRPAEIPGIESIVGSFVNNVPIRVKLEKSLNAIDWLKEIQRSGVKQAKYEHVALSDLHQYSALEANQNLFDSILLWLTPAPTEVGDSLEFEPVSANMRTAFPLTISIEEGVKGISLTLDLKDGFELRLSAADLFLAFSEILQKIAVLTKTSVLSDLGVNSSNEQQQVGSKSVYVKSEVPKLSDKIGRERVSRSDLIEFLTEQWKQILQLESVTVDDDFFALGGDSLKAAQLVLKIEQLERKSIPILALFQGRTINEMADVVLNRDWPVNASIVTVINKNGSQTPLFCIASPEVNTIGFANLAHHMGSDYPVYILQFPPIKDAIEEPEAGEIPKMASEYLDGMIISQPSGPYRLLGMCSGSQIAIEMARQMEQRGIELEFLGQINTWAFYTVSKWYYLEKLLNLGRYYKQRFSALPFKSLMQVIGSKLLPVKKNDSVELAAKPETTETSQYQPIQQVDPENGYSIINDVGWVNLLPELIKISTKVTVFKLAEQSYWRINDDALGWGKQAEQTEVILLDGRFHMAILRESHVPQLAEKIRQCLASNAGDSIRDVQHSPINQSVGI